MKEKELLQLIQKLIDENQLTPENLSKLIETTNKNPDVMSDADVQAAMSELQGHIARSPRTQELYSAMLRKNKSDKVAAQVTPFLQAALAGSDIVTSLNQVKKAQRESANLRRPARPGLPPQAPELQAAIDDARSRSLGIDTGALNALKLDNLDAYLGDLGAAKTASGGQAGLYGSLAQGAVNRRYRNNMRTLPLIEQSRQQNRARYDNLIGTKLNNDLQRAAAERQAYGLDLDQYNREAQATGRLEAQGRSNLRNSLYNAADILPGMIGNASTLSYRLPRTSMNNQTSRAYRPDPTELGTDQARYLERLQKDYEDSLLGNYVPDFTDPRYGFYQD